jgi:hypothetical protein
MRSGRYQLLSTMPALPFARQSKRHLSPVPRILVLSGIVIPFVVISFVLYKLAIITNAFRTYEAHPPTFSEPFRGKGEDVEPRVEAFPRWTTADTTDVDVTIWNVKKELSGRYSAAGLEVRRRVPAALRRLDRRDWLITCPLPSSLRSHASAARPSRRSAPTSRRCSKLATRTSSPLRRRRPTSISRRASTLRSTCTIRGPSSRI